MPIIKSAKKALRQTRKRTLANRSQKNLLQTKLGAFKKERNQKSLASLYSLVDKLTKSGIMHRNKASRLKSRLSRLSAPTEGSKKKTA
jgi:small subunit ribosomal protein S20